MSSWLKVKMGSDLGKDPEVPSHVGDEKTNMSEPLLTHRNRSTLTSKPVIECFPGRRVTPEARERPKCGSSDVRCKDGVSSSQALVENRRTCRVNRRYLTWSINSKARYLRDKPTSVKQHKWLSTDVTHRGGSTRSSYEGPVTGLEKRGRAVQGLTRGQPIWG